MIYRVVFLTLHANVWVVSWSDHKCFLPNHSPAIIPWLLYDIRNYNNHHQQTINILIMRTFSATFHTCYRTMLWHFARFWYHHHYYVHWSKKIWPLIFQCVSDYFCSLNSTTFQVTAFILLLETISYSAEGIYTYLCFDNKVCPSLAWKL